MVQVMDFNNLIPTIRTYGGNDGHKIGVLIEGEHWIIKFPQHSQSGKRTSDYSNTVLGEHLGSRYYAALGIPVQETLLGVHKGRIGQNELVVACKDFTTPSTRLKEFKTIKNAYLPSDGREGSQGSGNGTVLSDVLDVIENSAIMAAASGVSERFWDMFIVDFIIGNSDRNNTNWGLLETTTDEIVGLAPVFDNGRAFHEYALADSLGYETLNKPSLSEHYVCNYLDDGGHHIKPHEFLATHANLDCNAALVRVYEKAAAANARFLAEVHNLPNIAHGAVVISEQNIALLENILNNRLQRSIAPAAYRP